MRGAKPKVISEALGHALVAFTMDTYSHIIEGMQEDAMALLDEVLPSGVHRTSKRGSPNMSRSVAQLVEQRSPKPPVGGSSPPTPARNLAGVAESVDALA